MGRAGRNDLAAVVAALFAFGCSEASRSAPPACTSDAACDDGLFCNGVETCGGAGCQAGTPVACDDGDTCTADACDEATDACAHVAADAVVHALDADGKLIVFDPRLIGSADPFREIGPLACNPGTAVPGWTGGGVVPFALSVDRSQAARVLYSSGEIFSVSTADGSCSPTPFAPLQVSGRTWALFGMAYATAGAGQDAERLWIAGGSVDGSLGDLGQIDPVTWVVSQVGPIPGTAQSRPEMMGASDGTIWGFFPGTTSAFVQRFDRGNGALLGSPAAIPGGLGANVVAWGAAHWGGKFWIFVTTDELGTLNSTIRTIDRATGTYAIVRQNLPRVIVAAGSSTCAPLAP